MLQRGFKPAKCKTSLQMASSRLKILKNKKDIQIRQLKRELAQLLEAGQDQNARIRVEHVVREEKMVAAYELVGIYCELLVARMAVIESQKKCPNDLKEAVASLLFASRRMADVTELIDVHKHFTAKYGKDFASAAVELRPDCGVSRLLAEKLAVKAPDGPTKVKILSAIAEEYNVKWEPKSFGEPFSKLSEDLLSGTSNSFETAPKTHMHPPQSQNQESSYFQHSSPTGSGIGGSHKSTERYDVPANSRAYEGRSSSHSHSENVPSSHSSTTEPESYNSNTRLSGGKTEETESKHSFSADEDASPMNRRRWSMEFKDATAAAQAAAESAEIASMAARAAAELSTKERIMRQNSTESLQKRHSGSKLKSEGYAENHHSSGRNHRMQYEDMDSTTRQDKLAKEFQNDETKRNDDISTVRSSRQKSFEMRQSDSFGKKIDDSDSDVHVRKQPSRASPRSHSSNLGDDHDYLAHNSTKRVQGSSNKLNSHGDASDNDVLDDHGPSFDKPKFDSEDEHDDQEYGLGFSLLSQKSSGHRSRTASSWSCTENQEETIRKHGSHSHSFTKKNSSPVFDYVTTSSAVHFHVDDSVSVKYDDDSSSDSESEDKRRNADASASRVSAFDPPGRYPKPQRPLSERNRNSYNQPANERTNPESRSSSRFPAEEDSRSWENSQITEESSFESRTELKFGTLTGGLKNKGKTLPPYTRSRSRDKTEEEDDNTSSKSEQSSVSSRIGSKTRYSERPTEERSGKTHSRNQGPSSIDDDSEDPIRRRASNKSQGSYLKASLSPSSDDDEEVPEKASIVDTRQIVGQSRRTKWRAKISETSSFSRTSVFSEPQARTKDDEREKMKPKPKFYDQGTFRATPESKKPMQENRNTSSPAPRIHTSSDTIAPPSVESPKNRASHVHPKLPDSDDFFAKFGALRSKR